MAERAAGSEAGRLQPRTCLPVTADSTAGAGLGGGGVHAQHFELSLTVQLTLLTMK